MQKRPKRHHYLPRFLMQEFAVPDRPRNPCVRILTEGGVKTASVADVGVEQDFHSNRTMFVNPERILNREETVFSNALRSWPIGPLDRQQRVIAQRFAIHLRVRSRVMRQLIHELGMAILDSASGAVERAVQLQRPEVLVARRLEGLLDEVAAVTKAGEWTEAAREASVARVRAALTEEVGYWVVWQSAQLISESLSQEIVREVVGGAHTTTLLTDLVNSAAMPAASTLRWEVAKIKSSLLLGDVGPMMWMAGGEFRPLMPHTGGCCAIVLPIGPHRLLVGRFDATTHLPLARDLNLATVRLSQHLVIGAVSEGAMRRWQKHLSMGIGAFPVVEVLGVEQSSISNVPTLAATAAADLSKWVAGAFSKFCENRTGT